MRCDVIGDAGQFPDVLRTIATAMPCESCRIDLAQYMRHHPLPPLGTQGGCFAWAYALHDSVSAKIGASRMSLEDAWTHYHNMVHRGTGSGSNSGSRSGSGSCSTCGQTNGNNDDDDNDDDGGGTGTGGVCTDARACAPRVLSALTLTHDRIPVAVVAVVFGVAVAMLITACIVLARRGSTAH